MGGGDTIDGQSTSVALNNEHRYLQAVFVYKTLEMNYFNGFSKMNIKLLDFLVLFFLLL